MNLKPTFRFGNDLIVGTAVFVSADGEEFAGLSERQENYIWRMMSCVLYPIRLPEVMRCDLCTLHLLRPCVGHQYQTGYTEIGLCMPTLYMQQEE